MDKLKKWWHSWSPYWEYLEDRHFGLKQISKIESSVQSPILVIGAGQGLIVKYLRDKGFIADGIDLSREMIKEAYKRHKIKLIYADANKLPFKEESYKTVIISSGVVDYNDNVKSINKIIQEALRVTALNGNLYISFYQIDKILEVIYKKIGVIMGNKYYPKRIMDIGELSKKHPLRCLFPIKKWTKKNLFLIFLYWTKLGLTLPKILLDEQDNLDNIYKIAEKQNINPKILYDSMPEEIPYREINEIKIMMEDFNLRFYDIERYNDCIIVKAHKSGIKSDKHDINNNEKNWIIKLKDLSKKYKNSNVAAVDKINITIKKGTVFGLLGPNGAGKTTTLSILIGLLKKTDGEILFSNNPKEQDKSKIIGYIPQEIALYPNLTGIENLRFFGNLYSIDKKTLNNRINYLLKLVGLEERSNDLVKRYSAGMMRRINIAVGLINNPEIILMDEPTVGIDPQSRNHIFELIKSLKEKNKTIIYTTHYMEEADRLCDMVAIIDRGKIILQGNPKILLDQYGTFLINFSSNKNPDKNLIKELSKIKQISNININKKIISITAAAISDKIEIIKNIINKAKKLNYNLSLLDIKNPDLEALFLDLTGKSLRDGVEDENLIEGFYK